MTKAIGEVILYELARLGVKGRMLHWIGDCLFGRKAQIWFQGFLSQERHLRTRDDTRRCTEPNIIQYPYEQNSSALYCLSLGNTLNYTLHSSPPWSGEIITPPFVRKKFPEVTSYVRTYDSHSGQHRLGLFTTDLV